MRTVGNFILKYSQLSVFFFMAVLSLQLRTGLSNTKANPGLKTQDNSESNPR